MWNLHGARGRYAIIIRCRHYQLFTHSVALTVHVYRKMRYPVRMLLRRDDMRSKVPGLLTSRKM